MPVWLNRWTWTDVIICAFLSKDGPKKQQTIPAMHDTLCIAHAYGIYYLFPTNFIIMNIFSAFAYCFQIRDQMTMNLKPRSIAYKSNQWIYFGCFIRTAKQNMQTEGCSFKCIRINIWSTCVCVCVHLMCIITLNGDLVHLFINRNIWMPVLKCTFVEFSTVFGEIASVWVHLCVFNKWEIW